MHESLSIRRVFGILGVILITGSLTFYVTYQARNLLKGPSITLEGEYTVMQHEPMHTLTGVARNIVKLTVNGKEINTTSNGRFSHQIMLENGYSIVSLNAQDRFGRTAEIVREYVYVPLSLTE